jgi:hypothetical protein
MLFVYIKSLSNKKHLLESKDSNSYAGIAPPWRFTMSTYGISDENDGFDVLKTAVWLFFLH